jgi:hypothetical protein
MRDQDDEAFRRRFQAAADQLRQPQWAPTAVPLDDLAIAVAEQLKALQEQVAELQRRARE